MSLTLDRQTELSRPIAHRQLLIGGDWVDAADGGRLDISYPGDGRVYGSVAEGQTEDVDRAVRAARTAFDNGPWRRFKPAQRATALWRLGDLIMRDAHELARLETLDTGKPNHAVEQMEVPTAAGLFYYMSGWATKIEGSTIPISSAGEYLAYTERNPVGVVGLIVPWNFPLVIASWKLAPALAAGNTVVMKPAEWTPLTALHLGALVLEAGIPEGVVNVVPGFGGSAGAALTEHPLVDKISFTGSTATGRTILKAAAGNLKRVTLELGGKSPNVIFGDADLEAAIAGSAAGIFGNAGQACAAASRLFVQESVYDEVVAGIAQAADHVRVADAYDHTAEIGPLASGQHFERVNGYLDRGRAEGAQVVTGGDQVGQEGFFMRPAVLADRGGDTTVSREEIFGPVVVATPFRELADLVPAANATRYGLAAGVWTRDVTKAHSVARAIRSGTVWVNCYGVFDASLPFGGMKESGWGREMGSEVLNDYTEMKAVCVRIGD